METELKRLQEENQRLAEEAANLRHQMQTLQEEINHLRGCRICPVTPYARDPYDVVGNKYYHV